MAVTKIPPGTSVLTTLAGDHAFNTDSAAADTLIVDPDHALVLTGAGDFML